MNRDKLLLCCNKVLIGFSVYIDLFARQHDDEWTTSTVLVLYNIYTKCVMQEKKREDEENKGNKMFLISVCGVLLWFSIYLFIRGRDAKEKL